MERAIVAGDDIALALTITEVDEATGVESPVNISGATTVKAVICDAGFLRPLSPTVIVTDSHTGNDWANGIFVLVMSAADSIQITEYTRATAQVEVDKGGLKTYLVEGLKTVQKHIA